VLSREFRGVLALLMCCVLMAGCTLERKEETPKPTLSEVTEDLTTVPGTTPAATQNTAITPAASGVPTPTQFVLTAAPTLTGIPAAGTNGLPPSPNPSEVGTYMLQSSFDAPEAGWITTGDETVSRGFENGIYYLGITSPDNTRWGYTLGPSGTNVLHDIVIETDMRLSQTTGDAAYGILCRQGANENYYFFLINTSGQVQIGKMSNNNRIPLVDWTAAGTLRPSTEFNHIRVGCVGSTLWLEANGTLVARIDDTSFSSGAFGLFAVTNRAGTIRVDYDNFVGVGR
jgi:hypothetical protein